MVELFAFYVRSCFVCCGRHTDEAQDLEEMS